MTLKPWREIAVPHRDVLEGTFQQSEFAAAITAVHSGKATKEYQDPIALFERTFITEGMRLMPAGPICVDRFLGLRFMTVLAGRSL